MIQVKIKEQSFLARLAAKKMRSHSVAIVFGNTIHLWNVSRKGFLQNKRWVLHELEHIKQYKEKGFVLFIVLYLLESIRNGYHLNRFEVEARQAEERNSFHNDMFIV